MLGANKVPSQTHGKIMSLDTETGRGSKDGRKVFNLRGLSLINFKAIVFALKGPSISSNTGKFSTNSLIAPPI